ncbi:MAG: DUF1667 domain-containing protein [Lachnospiraceae bacterium]|jgi:CxxC motif-containing protein|nr:DUF1667 domain-containing protein [Lachnospiraceae bacterium]MEE3460371.1 DUF1667 domain-containing protein [Lachnospiraceae bacterium]
MEKRELTCIGCPMGCQITVELEDGRVMSLTGNSCPIGDRYARQEVTHPERTVTSTVAVNNRPSAPRLSVKTAHNIPKDKIWDCMGQINNVRIDAPVHIGDVIIKGVAGTDVDVVATRNIL